MSEGTTCQAPVDGSIVVPAASHSLVVPAVQGEWWRSDAPTYVGHVLASAPARSAYSPAGADVSSSTGTQAIEPILQLACSLVAPDASPRVSVGVSFSS